MKIEDVQIEVEFRSHADKKSLRRHRSPVTGRSPHLIKSLNTMLSSAVRLATCLRAPPPSLLLHSRVSPLASSSLSLAASSSPKRHFSDGGNDDDDNKKSSSDNNNNSNNNNVLSKSDLIQILSKEYEMTSAQSARVLDTVLDTIVEVSFV